MTFSGMATAMPARTRTQHRHRRSMIHEQDFAGNKQREDLGQQDNGADVGESRVNQGGRWCRVTGFFSGGGPKGQRKGAGEMCRRSQGQLAGEFRQVNAGGGGEGRCQFQARAAAVMLIPEQRGDTGRRLPDGRGSLPAGSRHGRTAARGHFETTREPVCPACQQVDNQKNPGYCSQFEKGSHIISGERDQLAA